MKEHGTSFFCSTGSLRRKEEAGEGVGGGGGDGVSSCLRGDLDKQPNQEKRELRTQHHREEPATLDFLSGQNLGLASLPVQRTPDSPPNYPSS